MRMVNAEGGMRTVESGGCGRSKSDVDSRIRRSYFWHELSSIEESLIACVGACTCTCIDSYFCHILHSLNMWITIVY